MDFPYKEMVEGIKNINHSIFLHLHVFIHELFNECLLYAETMFWRWNKRQNSYLQEPYMYKGEDDQSTKFKINAYT